MVWIGPTSSPDPVCRECRRARAMRTCANEKCGKLFRATDLGTLRESKYCSAACRDAANRIYDDPRASSKASGRVRRLRHAETWDGVEDGQIFERDGWACKISGCEFGPLRRDQVWPEPLSPVIDHIIPLSLGGTDTAPNKRAAHGICNLRKGNKVLPGDVQIITPELAPLGLLPARLRPGKPPKLCVVCETAKVRKAGATCASCKQAAQAERQQQALALREQGMSWAKVAVELGLSGPGAACNVANPPWDRYDFSAYEKKAGPVQKDKPARKKPVPAEGQEERLWWTTVRA